MSTYSVFYSNDVKEVSPPPPSHPLQKVEGEGGQRGEARHALSWPEAEFMNLQSHYTLSFLGIILDLGFLYGFLKP